MATGKKYWWIKVKEPFVNSDEFDFLMQQPNGARYIVFYLALCLSLANTEGVFKYQLGEKIRPISPDQIQGRMKWFSKAEVEMALDIFQEIGLVGVDDCGFMFIPDFQFFVNQESDWAEQKSRQRKRKKDGVDNVHINTMDNVHTDTAGSVHTDNRYQSIDIIPNKKSEYTSSPVQRLPEFQNMTEDEIPF